MRSLIAAITLLLVAGVCLTLFRSEEVARVGKEARAPAALVRRGDSTASTPDSPQILGRGVTEPDALKNALQKAKGIVDELLSEREPPLEWRPSTIYIRDHLLKGKPERLPDKDVRVDAETTVKCWAWRLTLGPAELQDIYAQDWHGRVSRRMFLLSRILAGLVGFFAIVAAYIRAEEWTKGCYTTWLRIAGIGALALLGAVIWWISP